MTTETRPRKTLSGTITDIAFKKDKNEKEFVEVSLLQPGQKYATKCRAFEAALVTRFHQAKKDTSIGLIIEEDAGTYQGKPITYRNIMGITKAMEGDTVPQQEKGAVLGKPEQAAPPVDSQAEREKATNRRTALMQAVAFTQGLGYEAGQLLVTAEEFADWLRGPKEDEPF